MKRTTAFLAVTLLLLLVGMLATPTTYADGYNFSGFTVGDGGTATLTREKKHIIITASINGLNGDHVFSVWGIINGGEAFNLTGFETGAEGTATFSGKAKVKKKLEITKFVIKIKDHGLPLDRKKDIKKQESTKWKNCPEDVKKKLDKQTNCPTVASGTFD